VPTHRWSASCYQHATDDRYSPKFYRSGGDRRVLTRYMPLTTTFAEFTWRDVGIGKLPPRPICASGLPGVQGARAYRCQSSPSARLGWRFVVKRKVGGLLHRISIRARIGGGGGCRSAAPYGTHSRGHCRARSYLHRRRLGEINDPVDPQRRTLAVSSRGGSASRFLWRPITATISSIPNSLSRYCGQLRPAGSASTRAISDESSARCANGKGMGPSFTRWSRNAPRETGSGVPRSYCWSPPDDSTDIDDSRRPRGSPEQIHFDTYLTPLEGQELLSPKDISDPTSYVAASFRR